MALGSVCAIKLYATQTKYVIAGNVQILVRVHKLNLPNQLATVVAIHALGIKNVMAQLVPMPQRAGGMMMGLRKSPKNAFVVILLVYQK